MKTLNITNGDCAVMTMEQAGISGEFLPWRDVLHEGPVPCGLSLDELSKVRARYIFDRGWTSLDGAKASFSERDTHLKSFRDYDKVILWFEHDLYDQLQILQILDWFADQHTLEARQKTRLNIICVDRYLGLLSPTEMSELVHEEKSITQIQLDLAKKAWAAFCAPSPIPWQSLLNENTAALPFLEGAIFRVLEEYPNCKNGLSRTASQALQLLASDKVSAGKLFGKYIETEERRFLGDASFWWILRDMLGSQPPLMTLPKGIELTLPTNREQILSITQAGKEVLAGKKNWLDLIQIDCWIGGVHLQNENIWCWDSESKKIVA